MIKLFRLESLDSAFDFFIGLVDNVAVTRQTTSRRSALLFLSLVVLAGGACANFQRRAGEPQTPPTLVAERRLRYAILTPVAVTADPNIAVPRTHEVELWQGVWSYMGQVGLQVVADPAQPHDVDVRLAMNVLGVSLLMRGSASLQVLAGGQIIDQMSTPEEIEPAPSFGKSMARGLVEALVHSAPLALFADTHTGSAPSMPGSTSTSGPAASGPAGPAFDGTAGVLPVEGPVAASGIAPSGSGSAQTPAVAVTTPAGSAAGVDRVAAAKASTRQGSAYYDVGRYADAYLEFERAYLLEQDPALLYNMGQCQRKLGKVDEAVHFYRTYLRRAPQGASAADAEKRIRELETPSAAKTKK